MTKTFYLHCQGCQMNAYDGGRLRALLTTRLAMIPTDRPEVADVLILNTCSIRAKAQEKVFSALGRWRPLKAARPGTLIGVGGCVASQEGEALRERAPFVDLVFGPQTLHRVAEMIEAIWQDGQPRVDVDFPELEKFACLPPVRATGPSADLTIMEGCDKYCSFCVVPYTRGEEISRPVADVLAEARSLLAQGVREINLLGQNVNAYRGLLIDGGEADLALLLHYLAAEAGLLRIRFTTSHPTAMTPALVAAFAEIPKLAGHLHLPVQSGADRILALMKRGHTVADYLATIDRLRAARPGLSISSDFIVGFPGETEADFQATLDLVERVGFDQSFSFIYSPRPGTPAAELPDTLPLNEKKRRLQVLQDRLARQATAIGAAMVGRVYPVLITGVSRRAPEVLTGRTENHRVVNLPGARDWIGQMLPVRIVANLAHSLLGEAELGARDEDSTLVPNPSPLAPHLLATHGLTHEYAA